MFLRPFHVRSNAAAKGTERKRLRKTVSGLFPEIEPAVLDLLLPTKCNLESIRLTTHLGVHVSVSVINKEPLFFEFHGQLFPTVYTLWQAGSLLQCVYTWPPVMEKLLGGADLMLPGVVGREKGGRTLEGLEKGQSCAVALVGNRIPVGVAVSLMSWHEMQECDMKGKGFKILHLFGDKLWELGSQSHPPPIYPTLTPPTSSSPTDTTTQSPHEPALESKSHIDVQQRLQLDDAKELDSDLHVAGSCTASDQRPPLAQGVQLPHNTVGEVLTEGTSIAADVETPDEWSTAGVQGDRVRGDDKEEGTMNEISEAVVPTQSLPEDPMKAMDELLQECFLQALKTSMTKTDLPLLTSTFYSAHMLPLCPAHLKLDIRKSSYKKLSRFLSVMTEAEVLKVEETGKGVESITSINHKHPLIGRFSPSLLDESDPSAATMVTLAESATSAAIRVTELYMPSHKLLPVFSACGHSKSSLLSATQVREAVTSYIRTNELVSAHNPRLVVLDPVLCDALLQKGEAPLEQMAWAQLMERVLGSMKPAFSITDGDSQPAIRKGRLQPVQMTVVQRTGNKKVTLVDNLDLYGISAVQLAHTVQRLAASSTTVMATPGKTSGEQVLVQGNAVKIIAKVLQNEYGLPVKFIEAVDKVKPPKKKSGRR